MKAEIMANKNEHSQKENSENEPQAENSEVVNSLVQADKSEKHDAPDKTRRKKLKKNKQDIAKLTLAELRKQAKKNEPLPLKIIFWVLLVLLLIGSPIAIFIFINKQKTNSQAVSVEVEINNAVSNFQKLIFFEKDYLESEDYEKAHDTAIEGYKKFKYVYALCKGYFKRFDEDVDGYKNVQDLFAELKELKRKFDELNKVDPLELAVRRKKAPH